MDYDTKQGLRLLSHSEADDMKLKTNDLSSPSESKSSLSPKPASSSPTSIKPGPPSSQDPSQASIRIYTKGPKLSSGFPYHPSLFDLQVHPTIWDSFNAQILSSSRLTGLSNATSIAVGVISHAPLPLARMIGRQTSVRLQESKIKAGLGKMDEGEVGGVLREWNEKYFAQRGLRVKLELSEVAMGREEKRSPIIPDVGSGGGRDRKKFVIVVEKVGTEGKGQGGGEVVNEVGAGVGRSELEGDERLKNGAVELVGDVPAELQGDDVKAVAEVEGEGKMVEAPGDVSKIVAELPGEGAVAELPADTTYFELESDNSNLLAKDSLMVTAETHAKLNS